MAKPTLTATQLVALYRAADDLSTPGDQLAEMATQPENRHLRAKAAANPSLPGETLRMLVRQGNEAAMQNTALPLLLLAEPCPDWLEEGVTVVGKGLVYSFFDILPHPRAPRTLSQWSYSVAVHHRPPNQNWQTVLTELNKKRPYSDHRASMLIGHMDLFLGLVPRASHAVLDLVAQLEAHLPSTKVTMKCHYYDTRDRCRRLVGLPPIARGSHAEAV
ncbi:MAG: hypothetical protein IT477_10665 [Rhodanobacteraceae bacterium]|nr:hypothetical protein [Rhodanobacteraceae bacterium]